MINLDVLFKITWIFYFAWVPIKSGNLQRWCIKPSKTTIIAFTVLVIIAF